MVNPTAIDAMSSAMADVYASVTDRILINLAHHFQYIQDGRAPTGSFEYQARMLAEMGQVTKESSDIIQAMLGGADEALKTVLENAIVESLKDEEPKLQQAATLGLIGKGSIPELTPNQMQAFKSYYNQSADKLNLVNTVMLESTQAAYTGVISDIVNRINTTQSILNASAGEVITGVSTWNKAMHDAVHRMVSNGLTGFIDHAGRRWSPEAYVAMDIRTTLFNTGRAAIWERQEQYGNDLYQVSSHNGARPLCYPWQGKVISRTDMVRDVEDLDGNTVHVYAQSETTYGQAAGLFGINCKHYPMTFIPGFSTLKGEPQSEKVNEKTYEESQQQRALERKLRFEKRELSVLKAQGADQETIKAQRNKVFEASADIDAFCDATGRARRRNREYTPINAKFPSKFGYDPKLFPTQQQQAMRDYFKNVASQATKTAASAVQSTVGVSSVTDFKGYKQYMKDTHGVDVTPGVKKLDLDLVKEATEGIESVTSEFTEVGETFKKICLSRRGVMSCDGELITFNSEYYTAKKDFADAVERCVKSGWWVKNASAGSIGAHEATHALEGILIELSGKKRGTRDWTRAWNNCTEARSILHEACDNLRKLPQYAQTDNMEMIKAISGYAYKGGASETMAEAFADVYANGTNAQPLSIEIRKVTAQRYNQYKGGTNP